jgi:hypothetical protein
MAPDPAVSEFTDLWASWLPRIAEDPTDPLLGIEIEAAASRLLASPVEIDESDRLVWALLLGHLRNFGLYLADGNAVGAWGAFLLAQDLLSGVTANVVQAALDEN